MTVVFTDKDVREALAHWVGDKFGVKLTPDRFRQEYSDEPDATKMVHKDKRSKYPDNLCVGYKASVPDKLASKIPCG